VNRFLPKAVLTKAWITSALCSLRTIPESWGIAVPTMLLRETPALGMTGLSSYSRLVRQTSVFPPPLPLSCSKPRRGWSSPPRPTPPILSTATNPGPDPGPCPHSGYGSLSSSNNDVISPRSRTRNNTMGTHPAITGRSPARRRRQSQPSRQRHQRSQ